MGCAMAPAAAWTISTHFKDFGRTPDDYDAKKQDVPAGGSGCGCSAVVLSAHILPKLAKRQWKRILFVPTGALLNKTSFNEGQNVPGIAHAVVIETLS